MNNQLRFPPKTKPLFNLLIWVSIAGASLYDIGLFIQNLFPYPANISVSEWWGSELAIRYCDGFVRRGILGQTSWLLGGLFKAQPLYVLALSALMIFSSIALGILLYRKLIQRVGIQTSLLILLSPTAYPAIITHAGSLFRKDAFQICLLALVFYLLGRLRSSQSGPQRLILFLLSSIVQVVAVFNHEPFALLILPAIFLSGIIEKRSFTHSFLTILPGLFAFVLSILNKGDPGDVICLQDDLYRLGLLPTGALPGSSITELALSKPSFFTWDLNHTQLMWSFVHAMTAVAITYACYVILAKTSSSRPLRKAFLILGLQLVVALPLFMATIDYGRWFAMISCSGILLLLNNRTSLRESPASLPTPLHKSPGQKLSCHLLAASLLFVLPSHCCTYSSSKIFAFVPYAGLSITKSNLKAILYDFSQRSAYVPHISSTKIPI